MVSDYEDMAIPAAADIDYGNVNEVCGYYNGKPEDEFYCRLWTEYISRPDVHPLFRQATEIDLAKFVLA